MHAVPDELGRCGTLLSRVRVEVFEQRAMGAKPIPEGFHTITPYLNIDGARLMMEFISKAF